MLYENLLLPGNSSIGKLDAYAKGHLFQLYPGKRSSFEAVLTKIALAKGVTQ